MPIQLPQRQQQYSGDGGSGSSDSGGSSSGGPGSPGGGLPNLATPIARSSNRGAQTVNKSFQFVLTASNAPQLVPQFTVPDGCQVHLRGNNGTTVGNAAVIFAGDFPAAFKSGHGTPIAPLDNIIWPVTSNKQIWIYGTAGDGVVVSVNSVTGNS